MSEAETAENRQKERLSEVASWVSSRFSKSARENMTEVWREEEEEKWVDGGGGRKELGQRGKKTKPEGYGEKYLPLNILKPKNMLSNLAIGCAEQHKQNRIT